MPCHRPKSEATSEKRGFGEPRYLDIILKAETQICKLLGLDKVVLDLNATKASRDAYIARFIQPIQEKLDAAGLKYHMKGRTKSIHSIWHNLCRRLVALGNL